MQVDQLANVFYRTHFEMRRQTMAQLLGIAIGTDCQHERCRVQQFVVMQWRDNDPVLTRLQAQFDGVLFEHHR
ncbi:hypothetical protein D3C76_1459010 [compost metagenome]